MYIKVINKKEYIQEKVLYALIERLRQEKVRKK